MIVVVVLVATAPHHCQHRILLASVIEGLSSSQQNVDYGDDDANRIVRLVLQIVVGLAWFYAVYLVRIPTLIPADSLFDHLIFHPEHENSACDSRKGQYSGLHLQRLLSALLLLVHILSRSKQKISRYPFSLFPFFSVAARPPRRQTMSSVTMESKQLWCNLSRRRVPCVYVLTQV